MAREICEAHPRWESCAPDPHAWTRRRAIIVLSAVEWIAAGAVETWLGNLWFGQVIAAGGVLGLILAKDLSRPRDDHRIVKADRSSNRAWLIYPLAAPVLIPRIVWLLARQG